MLGQASKFPKYSDPHERQFICSGRQCSGSGSVYFSAFSIIPRIRRFTFERLQFDTLFGENYIFLKYFMVILLASYGRGTQPKRLPSWFLASCKGSKQFNGLLWRQCGIKSVYCTYVRGEIHYGSYLDLKCANTFRE